MATDFFFLYFYFFILGSFAGWVRKSLTLLLCLCYWLCPHSSYCHYFQIEWVFKLHFSSFPFCCFVKLMLSVCKDNGFQFFLLITFQVLNFNGLLTICGTFFCRFASIFVTMILSQFQDLGVMSQCQGYELGSGLSVEVRVQGQV